MCCPMSFQCKYLTTRLSLYKHKQYYEKFIGKKTGFMDNAIRYAGFIKRIFTTSSSNIRKSLIQSSNDNIIKAICEILLNIYHKNLNISRESLRDMRKVKSAFLKIINKKTTMVKRKQLLVNNSEYFLGIQEVFK